MWQGMKCLTLQDPASRCSIVAPGTQPGKELPPAEICWVTTLHWNQCCSGQWQRGATYSKDSCQGWGGGAGSSRRGLHYLLCLLFCPFPAFLTLLRLCCGFSPLNLCFLLPATSFAPRSRLNACVSPDFKMLKPPPQCDDIWGWSL